MKVFFLIIVTMSFAISCRKDSNQGGTSSLNYQKNVKAALTDSLSKNDFEKLDFSKSIITNPDSNINYLRIPFSGINLSKKSVLLKTNSKGKILRGFIISLLKDTLEKNKSYAYNGVIKISSLNGRLLITSSVVNGYINEFHPDAMAFKSLVVPSQSNVLPDVIVTCYILPQNGGLSYSDWMSLMSFFGNFSGGGSGIYSAIDNANNYGSNVNNPDPNNAALNPSGISPDQTIIVDFEPLENLAPIDIEKYLKCFSNIPDDGATCSIEIFADIPVDDHPNIAFDWKNGSPGHTFLQIQKTRGNQSVLQNIGFYPEHGWKTLTASPVSAKFVDNSYHEYNAGLKMTLTPLQLKNCINHMISLKDMKYDIDNFNCTDFALDVFNYSRPSNPLDIPKISLPFGSTFTSINTPQGIYLTLESMQQQNIERANITIPGIKEWASPGNGPCN